MRLKLTHCILLFSLLLLTACSNEATSPSVATTASSTDGIQDSFPTATTGLPAVDLEEIEALVPAGTPAGEWHGVPVMPEAVAGDEKESGYVFSVAATADEIQSFYENALIEFGFTLLAVGHGQPEGALLLIFTKDSQTVALSLIPYQDLNLVLINR